MREDILNNSRILIIDDQPQNILLLERTLRQSGFRYLQGVTDSRQALTVFTEFEPDLVALDLQMPHLNGFDFLSQVRERIPKDAFLPIVVLTADHSSQAKRQALSMGARDFLTKPFDVTEVFLRIYNLLETRWLHVSLEQQNHLLEERVRERTRDLEQAQMEILSRLALAAEYRDDCTGEHTRRVGDLAARLGAAIGLPAPHVELIRLAAPLHDVGKIGIPDGILLKPSRLTAEEYEKIKTHTQIGRTILSGSHFAILQMAERIAYYHHERWDGRGYHGLRDEEIPIEARIVSIVDAFDVITHARPYKDAEAIETAIERIAEERGKQFDPALTEAFVELASSKGLGGLHEALVREMQPVAERLLI